MEDFYLNIVLPTLSKENTIVLTGNFALEYLGYSVTGVTTPDVLTDNKYLKNVRLLDRVNYCYIDKVNKTNYVTQFLNFKNILLPTAERVFVECIKYDLDFISEDYFCDSLERYTNSEDFNLSLLYEVADFFKVDRSKIDYWLTEVDDYNSY